MQIPFVDLKTQYDSIKHEIDAAIQSILEKSEFVQGETVYRFEQEFSQAQNVRHTIACGSGTDALHLALWALGLGPTDEVITASHTFIATAEAILLTGARPVFVDIDETSYTIDPTKIKPAISEKTRAIIPVHLYGQPCDIDTIREIAVQRGLFLVEDACQAHLAEYKGKKVGSFGQAGAFSFYPGKNLGAYGEAGAVVTQHTVLYDKMRRLRDHGQASKYVHDLWGHNYRMDEMQAAVLRVKLRCLQEWTEKRRRNARLYNERLASISEILIPQEMQYARHVYHLYVIRTPYRDQLREHLRKSGVRTGLHYPVPLHLQQGLSTMAYKEGDFPVTEKVAKEVLSLPMYPELTESQIDYVCSSIQQFFD